MPKSRFLPIICVSLLLVFVYNCNKGSVKTETTETSAQEHEQGEQEGEEEKGEQEREERGEQAGEREHAGELRSEHSEEGEHGREGGESSEGEEAGMRIAKDGTHDEVRKGVRLILSFDDESCTFMGTVENVTEMTGTGVRVEVHLSNGTELGPTKPIDLASGKKVEVKLSAKGQSFSWWKAHAEAGASEH